MKRSSRTQISPVAPPPIGVHPHEPGLKEASSGVQRRDWRRAGRACRLVHAALFAAHGNRGTQAAERPGKARAGVRSTRGGRIPPPAIPLYGARSFGGSAFMNFINAFLLVYAGLFPIVNPIGGAPIFLGLTAFYGEADRNALARQVAINSFVLLAG